MKFQRLRLYTAGLGFWLFAFTITLTYYPLIFILPLSSEKKRHLAQDSNAFFFGFYIRTLIFLGLIKVKIEGLDHIPKNNSCLFIANHPSLIDVLILLGSLPRVTCVIKSKAFKENILAIGVRMAGYLSNANPLELMEKAQNLLNNGSRVLIFPEGTRSKPGEKFKFARGAASLAMLTSCKIVPIFISSEPRVMFHGKSTWRDIKDFPIEYKVVLKEPIQPEIFKQYKNPTSKLNQKLEELYQVT